MFERELTLLLQQVDRERPHVRRRRGTFKRSKLRARDGGERISMPLGRGRGSGTPVCRWLWVSGGVVKLVCWPLRDWCGVLVEGWNREGLFFFLWAGPDGNICMSSC